MKANTRSSTIIGVGITVNIQDEIDNVAEEVELLLENGMLSTTTHLLDARYNVIAVVDSNGDPH